jgi:hypothetical protein
MARDQRDNQILPTEKANASSWREIVCSALLMTVVLLAANLLISTTNLSPGRLDSVVTNSTWQEILHPTGRTPDLMILGDSSGLYGVTPSVLDSVMGEIYSWNYCTAAPFMSLDDATMLMKFIDRHGPPREVLIVRSGVAWAESLHRATVQNIFIDYALFWNILWDFRNTVAFPVHDAIISAIRHTARLLPLVRRPKQISYFVKFPWRYQKDFAPKCRPLNRVRGQRRGMTARIDYIRENLRWCTNDWLPIIKDLETPISKENRIGLERIGELAQKHGFPVYLANGPILDELASDPGFATILTGVDSALASFAQTHKQIHYIPMLARHPLEDMRNTVTHLLSAPADKYTARLAAAVREVRNRDRAVARERLEQSL